MYSDRTGTDKNHPEQNLPVVGTRQLESQTKESARRDGAAVARLLCGHMFVLVGCGRGARPYVSIMRRWAICLYWLAVGVGLGHMFLLCGARLYVSIGWLWAWGSAICLYWLAVGHMFLLYVCMCICVCVYVYMCVCVCVCVYICECVCVFIGLPHHSEGTCWLYITSSNKLKLKCTLTNISKLCVNDPYKAATQRLVVDSNLQPFSCTASIFPLCP